MDAMSSHADTFAADLWQVAEVELKGPDLIAEDAYAAEVNVVFENTAGRTIVRPAFWDGGRTWRVRFASPQPSGTWHWRVEAPWPIQITSCVVNPPTSWQRCGLLRMSNGGRSVVRGDGSAFLVVADTAWALPFRATHAEVEEYAADRAAKGFNAVLLMAVQPDMNASRPESRTADEGFARAFDDLPLGRLTRLRPGYFQYLDRSVALLRQHGIVPVLQPVFHGYGWTGGRTAGPVVPPAEYARFCRYLVARYGAGPAMWLVCGDGSGREPGVEAGGRMIESCDAYRQPTGLHYGPHHLPNAHQSAGWLDFQWCQTGHGNRHHPERVMWMWHQEPPKAVANGEPTYERPGPSHGWWQGDEAWGNLCAGGTMGVVYGAMSLWQWKHHPDEPGHAEWCSTPQHGWREAMAQPGSTFVGNVSKILGGFDTRDLRPDWGATYGLPGLVRGDELLVLYAHEGGNVLCVREDIPPFYRIFDAKTAAVVTEGELPERTAAAPIPTLVTPPGPHVLVFSRLSP